MLALVRRYNIHELAFNAEAIRLADIYIQNNIIPARFRLDGTHIAVASVNMLDCVLSYNFEHINRPKTKILVGEVNSQEGYNSVIICTSKEVLDDGLQYV
jgi:hypothetical protein